RDRLDAEEGARDPTVGDQLGHDRGGGGDVDRGGHERLVGVAEEADRLVDPDDPAAQVDQPPAAVARQDERVGAQQVAGRVAAAPRAAGIRSAPTWIGAPGGATRTLLAGSGAVASAGSRPASLIRSPPSTTVTWPGRANGVWTFQSWNAARWARSTSAGPESA